jgi:hypothetical protein
LDAVAKHAMYTFLDGHSWYYQIQIALGDCYKTAFVTEWGAFVWHVMPFGVKNGPSTYQRVVDWVFKDYLGKFMKLVLEDFTNYNSFDDHVSKLWLCFIKCWEYGINLNLKSAY